MNFRDIACDHLAQYRVDVLGVKEDGLFHYRGQDIPKHHILPISNLEMNILEKYRDRFWSSEYADQTKVKLHRYFHHLNSSQALCFNLFYPLIAEESLGLFLGYIGVNQKGNPIPTFEKESELEVAERKTSFDFHIKLASASQIFVEVKYTEDGFGKAESDFEHQVKFLNTYLPLLVKSKYLRPECKGEQFFFNHYQILRNLVHISDTDIVVLLFPKANRLVAEQADYARDFLLSDKGKAKLKIVFLEDFVSFLEDKCRGGKLNGYYQDFRAKYLPLV